MRDGADDCLDEEEKERRKGSKSGRRGDGRRNPSADEKHREDPTEREHERRRQELEAHSELM